MLFRSTGAATAVAAKHLARQGASVASICGCGNQGRVQLRALAAVRQLTRAFAFDADADRANAFAAEMSRELRAPVSVAADVRKAVRESDLVVTCTPSRKALLYPGDLAAGTFLAAVGADGPDKQELYPGLLASSAIVVDVLDQCATIGELHHGLDAGLVSREDVRAELADVVAGKKPGRISEDEVVIFDSTGTALQDVAAAVAVFERAKERGRGLALALGE